MTEHLRAICPDCPDLIEFPRPITELVANDSALLHQIVAEHRSTHA